jgi:DNA-binding transcriptional LysR family regulator
MLNLERLRTLDALARHGSVSGAAAGLHVTTSAVSQQMAKLEREVGQQLLAKNGRGVRLTDAGRLLAEHAGRILSQVELAQSDLEAHRGQVVGELRISAFPTAARGLFPRALAALRAEHPGLRLRSQELEPEMGVAGVVRGDLDLAVVLDWYNKPMPLPDGLVKAAILDDPADVAMPADHPLAGRREVGLEDFAKGVEPRIGHRAAETHTQLGLVAAGLGVCVAPLLGRDPVPDGVVTVPVRQRVRRHVYVVWRADADRRPSIRAAVKALRGVGASLGGDAAPREGSPGES